MGLRRKVKYLEEQVEKLENRLIYSVEEVGGGPSLDPYTKPTIYGHVAAIERRLGLEVEVVRGSLPYTVAKKVKK